MAEKGRWVIGVDTGGTFTDLVGVDPDGKLHTFKLPSTPDDPARAVQDGLQRWLDADRATEGSVVHGSTVATNALLERKGARTAFVTNENFTDLLALGRQARPHLYALRVDARPGLVDDDLAVGVSGRLDHHGQELEPVDVTGLLERLRAANAESVAVCLLHSYANSAHEDAIAHAIGDALPVTLSSRLLPEYREYERAVTTWVNAYVTPKMGGYLKRIDDATTRAHTAKLSVMQSNGGTVSADIAAIEPVRTVLSGPAGGVVGAFAAARRAGFERAITFDMGGTSTDVALCDGQIVTTAEGSVAGLPVRVPLIDIHTVGAGGGSIAYVDAGGALKVGPNSAGADPGPACYGKGGTRPTVTDANAVLGLLDPTRFLGGRMPLHPERARDAMAPLAERMSMTIEDAARGIRRVVNASMEKAIRVISLERGHDPRDFVLVSFGGAGGLHACDLATALQIPTVVVPPRSGVLSAEGMLQADVVQDYSRTHIAGTDLARSFAELEQRAAPGAELSRSVDVRYVGQSFEISVPYSVQYEAAFHEAYEKRYGYAQPEAAIEVVTVRVRTVKKVEPIEFPVNPSPGARHVGPATVFEDHATIDIPPGWVGTVDLSHTLILERTR